MQKVIFEMDSVLIKEYLKHRFSIDKPMTYIMGTNLNLKVDVENLSFILTNEMVCEYTLGMDDNHTVEYIIFDKFTLGFYSEITPERLMESEKLRNTLKVGLFSKVTPMERAILISAAKDFGFRINKNQLCKRQFPYRLSKCVDYFVMKYPIIHNEKETSEDIEMFENVLYKLKQENTNILINK